MKRIGLPTLVAAFLAVAIAAPGTTAHGATFIRDAELEDIIKNFATPLWRAARLDAGAIRVHVILDQRLNAFVAGGRNIFLNTGLLMTATPEELAAVLAHESAHIAGGHLVRTQEAMRNATAEAIVGCLLAGAAVAASREPSLAAPVMQGCSDYGLRTMLHYTQTQESAADQAGMTILSRAGWSSRGMVSFLGKLAMGETRLARDRDPYLATHPLTGDRIKSVKTQAKKHGGGGLPEGLRQQHRIMLAKLTGFVAAPEETRLRYPTSDTSTAARYARAIALFRESNVHAAVSAMNGLLKQNPGNPYFHELKGQMLLESGQLSKALPAYRQAVKLSPRSYLMRTSLGQVLVGLGGNGNLKEAVTHLKVAVHHNPQFQPAWRLLGVAYGQAGDMALSSAALAEEAYLRGSKQDALFHIKHAEQGLKRGSRAQLRLEDLKREVQRMRQ